jgi:hypothetical protein
MVAEILYADILLGPMHLDQWYIGMTSQRAARLCERACTADDRQGKTMSKTGHSTREHGVSTVGLLAQKKKKRARKSTGQLG